MTETDKGSISQTKLWIIFTGIRKNPSPKYPDYQPLWSIPLPINQTRRGRMHETLFDRAALRRGKNNFFSNQSKSGSFKSSYVCTGTIYDKKINKNRRFKKPSRRKKNSFLSEKLRKSNKLFLHFEAVIGIWNTFLSHLIRYAPLQAIQINHEEKLVLLDHKINTFWRNMQWGLYNQKKHQKKTQSTALR